MIWWMKIISSDVLKTSFTQHISFLNSTIFGWQVINLNVLKLVSFLNDFDMNVRQKISKLDEKLTKLERTVDQVETVKQLRKLKNGDK